MRRVASRRVGVRLSGAINTAQREGAAGRGGEQADPGGDYEVRRVKSTERSSNVGHVTSYYNSSAVRGEWLLTRHAGLVAVVLNLLHEHVEQVAHLEHKAEGLVDAGR